MSDPRYTDPRLSEPPLQDDFQRRRLGELDKSNAMWGWIAGGIVLALLLVFVFGRSPTTTDQASNQMTAPPPGQSTLSPPSAPPTPPTAQRPMPSTTGQGSSQ